jgi:hypothetical protein
VTWFTLGNISVVGTYTTPEQSLTPRGLLAVTVAKAEGRRPYSALYRTVRHSRRVGSPIGTGIPVIIAQAVLINPPNE